MAVQELQAGGTGLRFEDIDDGWDALLGGEWRVGPAEPGPIVAGVGPGQPAKANGQHRAPPPTVR